MSTIVGITATLNKNLATTKKLEGGLFANVSINYCGKDFIARREIYTVLDSIVYAVVKNGELFATGDELANIELQCYRIGDYTPETLERLKTKTLSIKEVESMFFS